MDRATVRQKKTGRPVKFELTDQTRQAIDDYLKAAGKKPGDFLFTGRRGFGQCMTTRQYARLLAGWIASIGLDPKLFGTHSLRRTKATLIYRRTGNLRPCSSCLATPKSKAPSDTLASRWMMLSRLRNKSMSEIPGQSGHALPDQHRQIWANSVRTGHRPGSQQGAGTERDPLPRCVQRYKPHTVDANKHIARSSV